jgi:hypothetical protein
MGGISKRGTVQVSPGKDMRLHHKNNKQGKKDWGWGFSVRASTHQGPGTELKSQHFQERKNKNTDSLWNSFTF